MWGLTEVQDPKNMYPALVQQVIYKGSTVDLILKLKTGTQILTTQFFNEDDEKLDFRPGESVWVYWHTGWEVILADEA